MQNQFANKVAIVTGSTQGLGRAVATLLVERGCSKIVICGRRGQVGEQVARGLEEEGNAKARFIQADIGKVADCRRIVATCLEEFGKVDILVNVAGCTDRGTILSTSEELFDKMMAINLKGPYFLIQDVAKAMRIQGDGGSIVNIGSVAAVAGQPFISAYCTSKGALEILTKNTAFALMPDHIRVNCLNIGWMNTEGEDQVQRRYHGGKNGWLEEAGAKMPFGRLLDPAEVARAVAFLASEESGMMTGEAFIFDQTIPGAFLSQPTPVRLED